MASLLTRLSYLIRGQLGALLGRFENPDQQLAAFVADLDARVRDQQRTVAAALADEKRMEKQLHALHARSAEWEQRALTALEQGREDLARAALAEQESCALELESLRASWEEQKRATAALVDSLKQIRGQTDEARRKYNLLLARYKSAEARHAVQRTLGGASGDSPAQMLAHLEDRIHRTEAEAEVQIALAGDLDSSIEGEFRALESGRRTDAALVRLKAKLAGPRQLGPGAKGESDSDD